MFINVNAFFEESPSAMANEMLSGDEAEEIISPSNNKFTNIKGSKNIKSEELEPVIIQQKRSKTHGIQI